FFPMHYLGIQGMPRRVSDYAPRFADLNFFISIASFFLGASTLVFLYNMIVSWTRGAPAPPNPWRAHTLEWQVSPPPPGLQLAAACLHLRRDPAGRRRRVRVRRPRSEARGLQRRPGGRGGRGEGVSRATRPVWPENSGRSFSAGSTNRSRGCV